MEKMICFQKDSLVQKLKNNLLNNKKSLIRAMAGFGVSAMLLTGTGCDQIIKPNDTANLIQKETDNTYNVTETTQLVSPYDEYMDVEGFVSDLANEIISDPNYEENQKEFDDFADYCLNNGSLAVDCYNTKDNATCFDYFKNLYPNATEDEILKNTRVFYEFYGSEENSLYVILISDPKLSDNIEQGTDDWFYSLDSSYIYSLLEFTNLTVEEQRDLIKTKEEKETYIHSKLLNSILNSRKYKVLAENLRNTNYVYNSQFNSQLEGTVKYSISDYNEKNGKKYLYALVKDENNKNHFTLYYAQAELNYYDKERYKASPAVENIKQTMVFDDEELSNIFKFDKIFYSSNINGNLYSFYDYMNTKTP